MKLLIRRTVVVVGVAASLLLGVVSIRAAAAWTAASAPLEAAPVSVASVTDQLAREQARSAELQAQLDDLVARSTELTQVLEAAQARIATDASTAKGMRARLAAAEKKLAILTASLKARAAAAGAVAPTAVTPTAVRPAATSADGAAPAPGGGEHEALDD